VFGDNYFELYVNGRFVKGDPISFIPHQQVSFTFTADTSKPVEYAVFLADYMEDSTGLEYSHTALGDGAFLASFSDGTVTNTNWKCEVINQGPDIQQCCLNWDGTKNCDTGTEYSKNCVTKNFTFSDSWYQKGYNFKKWANASTFSTSGVGYGTIPLFFSPNSTCIVATPPVPGKSDNYNEYTTPSECINAALQNWGTASFIWGTNLVTDNRLLCRYTQPATTTTFSLAATNCPVCQASYPTEKKRRVRKEIRSLSKSEWNKVVKAFWIMKRVSQEEGEKRYGKFYREWDYFVTKHAVTVTDTRGDQGHFSAAFMTWHSMFLYEFENSLLAVDSSISGLPYWDSSSLSTKSVFTKKYLGSAPGTGVNHQVIDGRFAKFPVTQKFDLKRYQKYFNNPEFVNFTNSRTTDMLRSENNDNNNPYVTRFGDEFHFEHNDGIQCSTLLGYWSDWYECIELGRVRKIPITGKSFSWHSGAHVYTGSLQAGFQSLSKPIVIQGGDMLDVITSPNDPMFMLHHANLDRSKMWYMYNNYNKENIFWGFPVQNSVSVPANQVYPGINLNEEASSAWGFTRKLLGLKTPGNQDALLTHADALCMLNVWTAPYVYDDMQEEAQMRPGNRFLKHTGSS